MISTIFDTENEQMKTLIHGKQVIQNISYKLANDLNSVAFFGSVIENIKNYDLLERMKKYYFVNDLKEMRKVLHLLYGSLQTDIHIKNKTAEELVKCCSLFPDNIGKRIIMLISYIPILDLFYEDIRYEEYFKNFIDLDQKMMGETQLEHQYSRLFEESILSKTFPEDNDFIDYKLRNKYTSELKEKYEASRKQEISEALSLLLSYYEDQDDLDKVKVSIGSTYWEEKVKVKSKHAQAFAKAINAMSKALADK